MQYNCKSYHYRRRRECRNRLEYLTELIKIKTALNLLILSSFFGIIIIESYERSIFMCDTIYTIDDIKMDLHPVFVKHSIKKRFFLVRMLKDLSMVAVM